MKVLRLVEKIVFIVAVVVGAMSIALSLMMDEGAGAVGMMTLGALFFSTASAVLVFLFVGALLRFVPNQVARRIGEGFTLVAFVSAFAIALHGLVNVGGAGMTVYLGLVAVVLYAVSSIIRFIAYIVSVVKPQASKDNPDEDERIQKILKWKKLADDGIITKEEYEQKRVAILGLNEEKE